MLKERDWRCFVTGDRKAQRAAVLLSRNYQPKPGTVSAININSDSNGHAVSTMTKAITMISPAFGRLKHFSISALIRRKSPRDASSARGWMGRTFGSACGRNKLSPAE